MQFDERDVVKAANADAEFRLRARYWTATVRFDLGERAYDARVTDGELESFGAPGSTDPDIVVTGSPTAWQEMLEVTPKPYHVDFQLGMVSGIRAEGDMVTDLGPYGPAVQRLVAILRELTSGSGETWPDDHPFRDTDVAVGRYVYVDVDGITYRMYYEEAGEGVPLLLQHTAGADSRQWRHLLADPDLQQKFRLIAYDLPYHGRSLPPMSREHRWWEHQYAVTREDLMDRVVAFSRALGLDRPVFMGVSVGGQLATDLLAHHPESFRAAVSINGTYAPIDRDLFEKDGQLPFNDFMHHPRIHPDYYGALMYGATTPLGPEPFRRDLHWIYASGGPGVYRGDNEYHMFGHDLRENGHLIDTAKTPLYALVGEYDTGAVSATGARAIAENIPGVRFQVLEGLSHFMMADDPMRFRQAIIPILDEILEQTASAGTSAS
jgi:pimeloyl-ACP methyl ester carboxylesterase